MDKLLYTGIDFGTSGARAIVISNDQKICATSQVGYSSTVELAESWRIALFQLFGQLSQEIKDNVVSVAFDGTSATCMLVDEESGQILSQPKLYNESQNQKAVEFVKSIAPSDHTTISSTSSLCKLVAWDLDGVWQSLSQQGKSPVLMSQADWLASLLHGVRNVSDYNNVLKLGYDPEIEQYPTWLASQEFASTMPKKIVAPGTVIGQITNNGAQSSGFPKKCVICAGTTDSIAAFIAAGVFEVGEAVTSLGSTLAIKMLSDTRVDDAKYGIYSHRLGQGWLVGGASNTGGVVLRKFFTSEQLSQLSPKINADRPSPLNYYPLVDPGERFPVNDPNLLPRLQPRPDDDVEFLHGLLQGIANVEDMGYKLLMQLGASKLKRVYTAGGGAQNDVWIQIRKNLLGVDVIASPQVEAAYGVAILAKQGVISM